MALIARARRKLSDLPLDSVALRKQIQFTLDLTILVSAFVLTYLLRFDFVIPLDHFHQMLFQVPYVVLLQLTTLILAGVYSFIWRYIGLSEVRSFIKAALWTTIPIVLFRLLLPDRFHIWRVPFSIIIVDTILAFGGILLLRTLRRGLY